MDLHVVMAADDKYSQYMGTIILSLLENNVQDFETIYLYIIDNGISEENQQKLLDQSNTFPHTHMAFFNLKKRISALHPLVENGWDNSIYGRFFLNDVIDEKIDKVLYLDSDTIVNASLKELLSTDITEYCLAGTTDISGDERKEFLDMDPSFHYVNSGVLLVNMHKWRALNIEEKLIEYVNTFPKKLSCPDQDAINAVCGNMTLILPIKYNFGWMLSERRLKWDYYKADFHYSYEEIYDTIKNSYENVVIFHYFGILKPWRRDECPSEFEKPFLDYYEKSVWKQKRVFANRKKMLQYYFIRKPQRAFIWLFKHIFGVEKYENLCDFLETKKHESN